MLNKILKFLFQTNLAEKKLLVKQLFLTNENENIYTAIRLLNSIDLTHTKDSLIIDIGAYDGKTSQLLSKAFPQTEILAFEADTTGPMSGPFVRGSIPASVRHQKNKSDWTAELKNL